MNFAGECAVLDELQPHRWGTAADGVGDQFADDHFGGVGGFLVHSPEGELVLGVGTRCGDGLAVVVQMPSGHVIGGEGVGSGEEEKDVAVIGFAPQPVEHVVAETLKRPVGLGQHLPEGVRRRGRSQEGHGVEGQDTALGSAIHGGIRPGGHALSRSSVRGG
ncbi:hypothetical protein [Streptomyces spiralis]|uniref:hypothetical protein n=1 Tax=Streptomyces spiralis TaxID=66376 RepID=UPI001677B0AC|nr:hypothetical protein [Streptomyces spiralis]